MQSKKILYQLTHAIFAKASKSVLKLIEHKYKVDVLVECDWRWINQSHTSDLGCFDLSFASSHLLA